MLFVGCCLLLVVCGLLFAVCCGLLIVGGRSSMVVVRCVECCMLMVFDV